MSETLQSLEATQGEVQQFFSGRCVLLTGATGFCGKVLLEKLLRSCPGLENVYVLVRPRRGQDIHDRVANLLNQSMYDEPAVHPLGVGVVVVLQCEAPGPVVLNLYALIYAVQLFGSLSPETLMKVVPVAGDLSRPGLGLSLQDEEMLCWQVSVVFHMGASIRFNEDLRSAMETNVWATEAIVTLAKSMDHLKALVYVSTAYSNCLQQEIEEKVYSPVDNPKEMCKRLATMTPNEIASIEDTILRKWPNTYVFTKALAETVMNEICETLPVAIFRPSMVICMWKEPVEGWIDSMSGPTMFILGGFLGKMQCCLACESCTADFVPVDMVASGLIATAWDTARCSDRTTPRVYNFASGSRNPMTWGMFCRHSKECIKMYPSAKAVWYCNTFVTQYRRIYSVLSLLMGMVPALLMDFVPYISTGKHRNLDMYLKVKRFQHLVSYFTMRQWTFHDTNVVALLGKMSPKDKAVFQFDVSNIKWRQYIWSYVQGVRQHMLKESTSTLPAARKRYYRLYLLHRAVTAASWALLCACAVFILRRRQCR